MMNKMAYKLGDKVRLKGTKSVGVTSWAEFIFLNPDYKAGRIVKITGIDDFSESRVRYFIDNTHKAFGEKDFIPFKNINNE